KVIHFDSIIQFRMQPFKSLLMEYVGLAIDEFKREEDHQTFINTIREYVVKRREEYTTIHILQGDSFVFFLDDGQPIPKQELQSIMQKESLYLVGLDTEAWNFAPLVAMKPKHIIIYGNDPSEPKTLTVMNIFDELVTIKPVQQFPFSIRGLYKQL